MKLVYFLSIIFTFILEIVNAQNSAPVSARNMALEIDNLKKEIVDLKKKYNSLRSLKNNNIIDHSKIVINNPDNSEGYICINYIPKSPSLKLKSGTLMSITSDGLDYEITDNTNKERIVGILTDIGIIYSGKKSNFIAVHGIVKVRVVCRQGTKIKAGDLLGCSDASGIAMKSDQNNSNLAGPVIGKALEPYDNCYSEGAIMMLILIK